MFDSGEVRDWPGVTVAERRLRRLVRRHAVALLMPRPSPIDLVDVPARAVSWRPPVTVLTDRYQPHCEDAGSTPAAEGWPPGELARALEAGAAHLAAAKTAERAMARAAAERARALAAFCAARQAAVFDLPPGHPGAASAETRARRPAALTQVSE